MGRRVESGRKDNSKLPIVLLPPMPHDRLFFVIHSFWGSLTCHSNAENIHSFVVLMSMSEIATSQALMSIMLLKIMAKYSDLIRNTSLVRTIPITC